MRFPAGCPTLPPFRSAAFLGVAAVLTVLPAQAQVRQPQFADLYAVFPAGGQRGQALTVSVTGKDLHGARQVLVSGEGVEARAVRSKGERDVQVDLAIRADAEPGVRSLRVVGERGVSDPAWFVVGALPERVEQEPNNSPSSASETVSAPVVLNGRLGENLDVDYFRFRAKAGEKLVVALAGYSLDAQTGDPGGRYLDASLTVFDAAGRVLEGSEDYTTLDPALTFEPPADGEYSVAVRDVGYLGHARAVYRLTLTAAPHPVSLYPAGGRRGARVPVLLNGLNMASDTSGTVVLPADAPPGRRLCGAIGAVPRWVSPVDGAASALPFVVGDLPESLEQEPNDALAAANPARFPSTVNGRLERTGDQDRFAMDLKKGEGLTLDALAGRVLRSPVDLALSVSDAAGALLAENDDSPLTFEATANRSDSISGDPRLEFVAPADGRYVVTVRDVAGRGGPHCVYRLTLTRREPGFGLTTWYDNPSIKGPGGTGVIVVMIQRWGGYQGPVRVRMDGLPPGYTGSEAILPPVSARLNVTATVLSLTAPPDAAVGTAVPFQIVGEAEIEGKPYGTIAEPRAHLGQNSDHAIFRATETCVAGVVPADEFRVRTEVREVSGKAGETVRIPVTIEREPGFSGPVSLLALRGIPTIFGAPVSVPQNAERFEFPLAIPADLPPGEHSFVLCRPLYGDFRSDRPHTSTPVITLTVKEGS